MAPPPRLAIAIALASAVLSGHAGRLTALLEAVRAHGRDDRLDRRGAGAPRGAIAVVIALYLAFRARRHVRS